MGPENFTEAHRSALLSECSAGASRGRSAAAAGGSFSVDAFLNLSPTIALNLASARMVSRS